MLKFSKLPDKKVFIWFVVLVVFGVIVGFGFIRGKSYLGKDSKKDVFDPDKNAGFIRKTNEFLDYLLEIKDKNRDIQVKGIDDLNKKYPALVFTIPFDELGEMSTPFIHTSDFRLVDINIDMVEDEGWKKFYYNSSLPSILSKQRSNIDLNYFKIKFAKDSNDIITVRDIELIASLFRQPFEKKMWTGTIMASDGNLFPKNKFCFLSWGTNVLPIKHSVRGNANDYVVSAYLTRNYFTKDNSKLELIDISKNNSETAYKQIALKIYKTENAVTPVGTINLKYLDGEKIEIKTDRDLSCEVNLRGKQQMLVKPTNADGRYESVDFTNDIKLVFYDESNVKMAEMVLTHENPMLLLSGVTKSNAGLSRYIINHNLTDRFTQQVIRGASSMLTDLEINDTVMLTLNPFFSRWLQDEMKYYIDSLKNHFLRSGIGNKNDRWEMSVTVVDMATGNVVAMPFYRTEDENIPYSLSLTRKNPALTRRYIGSAFKPLLTLAAVLTRPDIIYLDTRKNRIYERNYGGNMPDTTAKMLGFPIYRWANSQWGGRSGIVDFLTRSCDVYPVALTLLAMDPGTGLRLGGNIFKTSPSGDNMSFYEEKSDKFHWNNLPFVDTLARIYSVKSYSEREDGENSKQSRYLWRNIYDRWDTLSEDKTRSVEMVSPDVAIMRYDAFDKEPHKVRDNIVPWVLGQGSNEWSALGLAEAWCRMLTRRNVKVSMVRSKELKYPEIIPSNRRIWNVFLSQLDSAQSAGGNLLSPMKNALNALNSRTHRSGNAELMLFSKTGTPDNYDRQEYLNIENAKLQYDVGLYCMGIMTRGSYNNIRSGLQGRGVMCVIRMTRVSTTRDGMNGLESKHARNFFSEKISRLEKFYWFTRNYYW